jgi:Tfp pilus assembly protein PilV
MRTAGKHSTSKALCCMRPLWTLDVFSHHRSLRAFSLLEVMIAIAIFFMCSFAILALVSSGLRTARMLKNTRPKPSMIAVELFTTNLVEGVESGDFGRMYPDHQWETDTYEYGTNGLVQVDISITRRGQHVPESTLSVWKFDPSFKSKGLGLRR